jgi:hypothetical protein
VPSHNNKPQISAGQMKENKSIINNVPGVKQRNEETVYKYKIRNG